MCRLKAILFGAVLPLAILPIPQTGLSQESVRQSNVEKYYREKNPKNQIGVATQLSQADLKELIAIFKTDTPGESGSKARANYLTAIDMLRSALTSAQNPGASKKAEVSLRQQIRSLEQLMFSLSYEERTAFEPVLETVRQVHREALDIVMRK